MAKGKVPAVDIEHLQKMSADVSHALARLHDSQPEAMAVLVEAVRRRLATEDLPPLTARYDALDDPAVIGAISKCTGPLMASLMEDNNARSALGRLAAAYAKLPATSATRLRTTKDMHSIGAAIFAGFAIGTIVVIVVIAYLAVSEEDEDYEP
jgi:hypothetical protein